jgi:uncharacterized iron-regulated membrane protein
MNKFNPYQLARAVHRYSMFGFLIAAVVMGTTGFFLKFTFIANKLNIDLALMRYLHNQMSLFFSIFLFLMALSGLTMYLYPILKNKK